MTRLLFFLLLFFFLASCKKSDDPIVEPVPPVIPPTVIDDCPPANGLLEIPGWKQHTVAVDNGPGFDAKLYFLNEAVGFLYDTGGKLLRTTDGGENWENVASQSPQFNQHLFFLNDQQGFLSIRDNNASNSFTGALLKTNDGGTTWERHTYQPAGRLQKIFFMDELHGFAHVVRSSPTSFSASTFARTEDGGATWQDIAGVIPVSTGYSGLHIYPDGFGYLAGTSGRVFITVDNGEDWEVVHTGLPNIQQVQFLDKMNGYVSAYEGLFKTTDGGKTWAQVSQNYAAYLHFFNPQNGFTIQSYSNYLSGGDVFIECFAVTQTDDGGETWTKSEPAADIHYTSFFFPNDQRGFSYSGDLMILEKE